MQTQISLVRIAIALLAGLLLFGVVGLYLTGNLWHEIAAARGYAHAKWDLALGRRVLHTSAHRPWGGRRHLPIGWLRNCGVEVEVEHFACLSSSPCASYHHAYDSQVRRAINHEFGYDVFSEYASFPRTNISIVVQHR